MNELSLSSYDLQWCFAVSGCDNVTGITSVGFKTALSACRQHANVLDRLPKVAAADKERVASSLYAYLASLLDRPGFPTLVQETSSLLKFFVFELNADGTRKRLKRLIQDPTSNYGIGVQKDSHETVKDKVNTGVRSTAEIDNKKATNHRRFEFKLTSGIESPSSRGKYEAKPKQTRKVDKHHDPKTQEEKVVQRVRNQDKVAIDKIKSLHMPCSRLIGTVKNTCCLPEFSSWFQKDMLSLKVS